MERLCPDVLGVIIGGCQSHVTWSVFLTVSKTIANYVKMYIESEKLDLKMTGGDMNDMASKGWLTLMQWARGQGCPWGEGTCAMAARDGHLEVLQWARSQGCPWNTWTCAYATLSGHLAVLQWARSQGCPWTRPCEELAKANWPDVFQDWRGLGPFALHLTVTPIMTILVSSVTMRDKVSEKS